MADLAARQRLPEIMDDPALEAGRHNRALAGLARINVVSGSARIVAQPIFVLARQRAGTLRVLDLATGGGDVPVRLQRSARRRGVDICVHGCDVSEQAVAFARQREGGVHFFQLDALNDPIPDDYDVIMCSLFLHHLDDAKAAALLKKMCAAARRMIVVNDLDRSRMGYIAVVIGTRLLTFSDVVHTDGLLSVRAAFTVDEVEQLARDAGCEGSAVRRCFPWRWRLVWERP